MNFEGRDTDMRPSPNEECGGCAAVNRLVLALVLLPIVIAWPLVGVAISAVAFVIHLRLAIAGSLGNKRALVETPLVNPWVSPKLAEMPQVLQRGRDGHLHGMGRRGLLAFGSLKHLAQGAALMLAKLRTWHVNLPTWRIANPRVAGAH
ncbi:hypothetical protein K2X96_02985 [Patescibacteria group bacterium]|nr:hypothetical protein [Patescibacteria group bacterium]